MFLQQQLVRVYKMMLCKLQPTMLEKQGSTLSLINKLVLFFLHELPVHKTYNLLNMLVKCLAQGHVLWPGVLHKMLLSIRMGTSTYYVFFCNVLMYFLGCLPNLQRTSRQLQERIIQKKIFIQPICLYLINNKNKNIFGNKIKANITN